MSNKTAHRGPIAHITEDPALAGHEKAISYFEDGCLLVENGRVIACDDWQRINPDNAEWAIINRENSLILPGFVDSHIHFAQTDIIGGYGRDLLHWLHKHAFPIEQKIGADQTYAADTAKFFVDELIRNGTTSALVFGTVHAHSADAVFQAALAKNMRLIAGKVLMNQNAPEELCEPMATGHAKTISLIEKWQNRGRLGYAVTPRFAPTSSFEQLKDAGALLHEYPDVLLHTHLSENAGEIKLVAELFPGHKDYLEVYERAGLVGERSVFAHCIHLSDDERKRIARAGASIAFCPTSNLFLGSGLFDLSKARNCGINVGLGSDIGAGTSFSLLDTQLEAYKVGQLQETPLHPVEALYLATLGGARALHIEQKIGNFESGKEADFIVLDLGATELLARRTHNVTQIAELLFCLSVLGSKQAVAETWIAGKSAYKK